MRRCPIIFLLPMPFSAAIGHEAHALRVKRRQARVAVLKARAYEAKVEYVVKNTRLQTEATARPSAFNEIVCASSVHRPMRKKNGAVQ